MTTWTLEEICTSVSTFSEVAFRRAIDEARQPDKAQPLIRRLSDLLDQNDDTFVTLALCVVLGEAHCEAAIPTLIRAATSLQMEWAHEAAAYALRRMGEPAFEAAMRWIPEQSDAEMRVLGYEILAAAMDAKPRLKQRVAEYCVARIREESKTEWPEDAWNPQEAVEFVFQGLGPSFIRPLVEAEIAAAGSDKERAVWKEFSRVHNAPIDRATFDVDWRIGWPAQCENWAEAFAELDCDTDPEWSEEEIEERAERVSEEFRESAFAQTIPNLSGEYAAAIIHELLDWGGRYCRLHPGRLTTEGLEETLYEIIPEKISAEIEHFREIPRALAAFIEFMHDTGRLADPEPFRRIAQQAKSKLPRIAADPSNWGLAKSMMMAGHAAGYDMSTREGADAWFMEYNRRAAMRRVPTRINAPSAINSKGGRVGRNDPCPCGSGHKFKKCCGRV